MKVSDAPIIQQKNRQQLAAFLLACVGLIAKKAINDS
jgi:hypothetical protein